MSFAASSSDVAALVSDDASPRARNGTRGETVVVAKGDSPRVNQGLSARERVHPLLVEMVRAQEQELGSRMRAYDVVGHWIGVKRTWVRRLIGRQEVGLTGDRLLAIAAAYRAHCSRVASRAAEIRAETARRQEEIDAILAGVGRPGPELGGQPAESAHPSGAAVPCRERRS